MGHFETFGESDRLQKITAISQLSTPDRGTGSKQGSVQHPYNQQSKQEFHYSGSFGVPQVSQYEDLGGAVQDKREIDYMKNWSYVLQSPEFFPDDMEDSHVVNIDTAGDEISPEFSESDYDDDLMGSLNGRKSANGCYEEDSQSSAADASTVAAVRKKILGDPEYRR